MCQILSRTLQLRANMEITKAVADLRGGARDARPPPLAQNFFIFMQFSGKIDQIIGWRPPSGVSAPSSGKSWIRHCKGLFYGNKIVFTQENLTAALWGRCAASGLEVPHVLRHHFITSLLIVLNHSLVCFQRESINKFPNREKWTNLNGYYVLIVKYLIKYIST